MLVALVSLVVVASAGATTLISSPRDVSRVFLPGQPRFSDGAVAVSPDGQFVYVVVRSRNRLYEFSTRGALEKIWTSHRLRGPRGVTTDGLGDVYVADQASGKVIKFTADGRFVAQWSVPDPISIAAAPKGPGVRAARRCSQPRRGVHAGGPEDCGASTRTFPDGGISYYGYTQAPRTSARAIGVDTPAT